jgi:hypothetical protein
LQNAKQAENGRLKKTVPPYKVLKNKENNVGTGFALTLVKTTQSGAEP